MTKDRLYSLDMMKFVAAIFITNSHFQPLYEGVNTAFVYYGYKLAVYKWTDWCVGKSPLDKWISFVATFTLEF